MDVDPTVSGVSPVQPTPASDQKPSLGSMDAGKQKPFTTAPEPLEKGAGAKPTPMELAKDRNAQPPWTNEQLKDKLEATKIQYEGYQNRLKGPEGRNLSSDHLQALGKVTDKLNPDLKTIAQTTNQNFSPEKGKGPLVDALNWLGGAQDTFGGALNYLETTPSMNPADFLKMQYSIQRAAQRGELFASVIGSSVSGIKTLMSTQLG